MITDNPVSINIIHAFNNNWKQMRLPKHMQNKNNINLFI